MVVIGAKASQGRDGRPVTYHIESHEVRGQSYCGSEFKTRWSLPRLPEEDPARGYELICEVCRKAYDAHLRAKGRH